MKQGPLLCSDHLSDLPPPMWRLVQRPINSPLWPPRPPPAPEKWLLQVPGPGQLCQVVCGYKSTPWSQSRTSNKSLTLHVNRATHSTFFPLKPTPRPTTGPCVVFNADIRAAAEQELKPRAASCCDTDLKEDRCHGGAVVNTGTTTCDRRNVPIL